MDVVEGKKEIQPIPERRPKREDRAQIRKKKYNVKASSISYPVWRCKVCGYLCARGEPPEICPICKAKKDRFEKFIS